MPPFAPSLVFDFSQFFGGDKTRPVTSLGLTEDATAALLDNPYGLSKALLDKFPDVTKRGEGPNAVTRCLIVFEANGRDTTYEAIGQACNISVDTAYQQMTKARNWVRAAFMLEIETSGERVYLVSRDSVRVKCERIQNRIDTITKVLKDLDADVKSVVRSGDVPILPRATELYLEAHRQAAAETTQEVG